MHKKLIVFYNLFKKISYNKVFYLRKVKFTQKQINLLPWRKKHLKSRKCTWQKIGFLSVLGLVGLLIMRSWLATSNLSSKSSITLPSKKMPLKTVNPQKTPILIQYDLSQLKMGGFLKKTSCNTDPICVIGLINTPREHGVPVVVGDTVGRQQAEVLKIDMDGIQLALGETPAFLWIRPVNVPLLNTP